MRLAQIAVLTALASLALAASATAARPPSLPALEPQLMCVTCKIPLNVAQSAEANQEREVIKQLIAEGKDEAQIKHALVGQYGPAVLSTPSTKGFQLSAYLVPIAAVLALGVLALTLLPRWRRAARSREAQRPPAPTLTPAEAQRLRRDMGRFE
jgi:cytochrome c-type biogenesis protein CcmH